MILVVGLGNPGIKYRSNRHNAGYLFLDYLIKSNIPDNNKKITDMFFKHNGFIKKKNYDFIKYDGYNEQVILIKPTTYMNLSGNAILSAMSFYKITPQNIIVIYDDIALPLGKIRIRAEGSDGGHNGIKNIISIINTNKFNRIRIGIESPPEDTHLISHVLGNFNEQELSELNNTIFQKVENGLKLIIENSIQDAMNRINGQDA